MLAAIRFKPGALLTRALSQPGMGDYWHQGW